MNFRETAYKQLATYKTDILKVAENGIYKGDGKQRPHILPIEKFKLNILEEFRDDFWESEYSKIKRHMYFHHLNSSQAMCINLFFPLIAERALNLIMEHLNLEEGVNLKATFEKESDLEEAARRTNFDFHLQCSNSTCTDIFFEVKYTENGFGKAKADDEHKQKFCATYLPLVTRSKYLSKECLNESFFLNHYQLLRNLVHVDNTKYVVFLFPSANLAAKKEAEDVFKRLLSDSGKNMVKTVYLEDFVTFLETKKLKESLSRYYPAFRKKYIPT